MLGIEKTAYPDRVDIEGQEILGVVQTLYYVLKVARET